MNQSQNILTDIVDKYPGFIVHILDKFTVDYDMFNETWALLCSKHIPAKPTPKNLLLVSSIENSDLCDMLTEQGYCIRKTTEFQPCDGHCNKAIATPELHTFLVSKGFDVGWNRYCRDCLHTKTISID